MNVNGNTSITFNFFSFCLLIWYNLSCKCLGMCPGHYFYWSVSLFITLNEYSFNFLSHLWAHFINVRIILTSLWVLNTTLILVSSANLMTWLITALSRPLNKIWKSAGVNLQPCGTSLLSRWLSILPPITLVFWVLTGTLELLVTETMQLLLLLESTEFFTGKVGAP